MLSTLTVVNVDDSGPGSLRAAIKDANSSVGVPDVIEFASGVKGTINLTSGQLEITDDLTIHGPGKSGSGHHSHSNRWDQTNKLTISGSGLSRVFDVTTPEGSGTLTSVAMNHLRIADGFATQVLLDGPNPANGTAGGAGIRATNSIVNLEHVVLENNRVVDSVFAAGAAIQSRMGSSVSLDHVAVRNNEAIGLFYTSGGAIQSDGESTLTIEHSTFDGNRAANHPDSTYSLGGGAIGISGGGQTTIRHSQFTDNQVDGNNSSGGGGAISNSLGSLLEVDYSRFRDNSAAGLTAAGGAISNDFNFQAPIVVSNSQFVGNSAVAASQIREVDGVESVIGGDAQGGAISISRISSGIITGSHFVGNTARGDVLAAGGAIANTTGSTLTVDHSSIVNNQVISAGDAFGGGIYNDGLFTSIFGGYFTGTSNSTLTHSNVNANQANPRRATSHCRGRSQDAHQADGGNGVGGGVYDAGNEEVATFFTDTFSRIRGNKASTSHDNVFGDPILLDDLLAIV